jgi:conjugal transfer pilus assembly protein TraV
MRTQTLTPVVVTLAVMLLSACSSMSGYDAKSSFACKAPDGILCESMSGIYANARAHNLPGQRVNGRGETEAELPRTKTGGAVMTRPIESGTPIRSAPRVLRVWFAPWEDSDGDLHDQSYVYLPVDSGRWLIEHNRRRIQDSYRPVRAPGNVSAQAGAPAAQGSPGNPGSQGVGGPPRQGFGPMAGPAADSSSQEFVGVRQDRMGSEQAAELLSGVLRPAQVVPDGE